MMDDDGWEAFAPPKKRKMTKEKAMLGDWAESDSDEDYDHFSSHSGSKKKKSSSSSSMGISSSPFMFVSSGVYDLSASKKENEKPEEKEEKEPPKHKKPKKTKPEPELGSWEKHSKGIGSKLLKKMGWKGGGLGPDESGIVKPIAAIARSVTKGLDESDYMGIDKSVYRPDEVSKERKEEEEGQEEERVGQWKKSSATQPTAPAKPKTIYKTLADLEKSNQVSEIKANSQLIVDMRGPQVKILSGLSGVSSTPTDEGISSPKRQFLPQLKHNMSHLVEILVNSIHSIVQKRKYDEAMVQSLSKDEVTLEKQVSDHQSKIESLESLKELIEGLAIKSKTRPTENQENNDGLTLDFLAKFWILIKNKFKFEFSRYKLESLAFHYVFPLIQYELLSWRPLIKPHFGLEMITRWKSLLTDEEEDKDEELQAMDSFLAHHMSKQLSMQNSNGYEDDDFGISQKIKTSFMNKKLDTFNRLIYEIVLPKFKQALSAEWDSNDPDCALSLLEAWRPVLPTLAYNHLLYHVILIRLKDAVNSYSPKAVTGSSHKPLPIDSWVLPWIPIMGRDKIHSLFAEIRRKLQALVRTMSPEEAVPLILPFKHAFDPNNWSQLIARGVLPKIESLVRAIDIDPSDQQLSNWNLAMKWSELVSTEALALAIEESGFWSKWFNILGTWLNQPNCDEDQIQEWYSSWKDIFPKPLQAHELVKAQFRLALQLMLSASSGDVPNISEFKPAKVSLSSLAAPVPEKRAKEVPYAPEASMKEVIASVAEERGILFIPSNKKYEGNIVYSFGAVQMYIDRDIIYTYHPDGPNWRPTSLHDLMTQATN